MDAVEQFPRPHSEDSGIVFQMQSIQQGMVGIKNLAFIVENDNQFGKNVQYGTAFQFPFELFGFSLDQAGAFSLGRGKGTRPGRV
ncbi:hypothetical protein SDC9_166305 [bioreactor metagenome]|uniref:Uncharacterized protein n=1 Tax=bioreactor metagenome TaxID=1076179 RepID=A0A645FZ71_9ZZZZ